MSGWREIFAGTFMYHTHFNDFVQLSNGLYGVLIVTEPGAPVDPAIDHTFIVSRGGVSDEKSPVSSTARFPLRR